MAHKTQQVKFTSRISDHTFVVEPTEEKLVNGKPRGQILGTKFEFENHQLVVKLAPDAKQDSNKRGMIVTRSKPRYEEILDWLREHDSYNHNIWGFYEVGREPGRPLPTEEELLPQIVAAAARGDDEALAEMYRAEDGTHKREMILTTIKDALRALPDKTPKSKPKSQEEPVNA